jgi:hypothetical protein
MISTLRLPFLAPFLGMVALTVLPLFAESTSVKIGTNTSLTMPDTWKVLTSHQDPADFRQPQRPGFNLGAQSATLLLSACPNDSQRQAALSVYRINFQGPGPTPSENPMSRSIEAEKLLCTVLSFGYSPEKVENSAFSTPEGAKVLLIEVTAKNSGGDERVFSAATTTGPGPSLVRISSNRAKNDDAAARELTAIFHSLSLGENVAGDAQPAPTGTPVPVSAQAAQIVSEFSDALVIIEGKDAVGSGFICTTGNGQAFVYTNVHVAAGSGGFKLTNLKSVNVQPGPAGLAVGRDILRLETKDPAKAFALMENLDSKVKIGDEVVILGNMRGGMVVKPVEGKIQGIGPDLVEVDAPFEPGNSGSPIIHKATGQVIGIATYLTQQKVGNHQTGTTVEVRRFGYRLDNVKTWEPINWPVFFAQAAAFNKIQEVSQDLIRFSNADSNSRIETSSYKSPSMQRVIQNLLGHTKSHGNLGQGEQKMLVEQLLRDLRSVAKNDLVSIDPRTAYDYFRREMEDQVKFRDEVYQNISKKLDQSPF